MSHPFVEAGYTQERDPKHAFVHMIYSAELADIILQEAKNGNLSNRELTDLFLHDLTPEQLQEVDDLDIYRIKEADLDITGLYHNILTQRDADLRRGDIIQEEWEDYRNTGTYIYDGKEIIELDDQPDDYGTLPRQFLALKEFPINYWEGRIVHNNWTHVDLSETTNWKGLLYRDSPHKWAAKYEVFAQFDHRGTTYTLIVGYFDNFDDKEELTARVREVAALKAKGVVSMWYYEDTEYTLNLEAL